MARIKIELPVNKIAEVNIPVRISDVNYGNHVGNDAFVSLIHEARMQWLKRHNFSELNFAGEALIMSDLAIAIEFKSESFYGDTIKAEIFAGAISRVSFELFYRLSTERDSKQILLAHAKTGMLTYNYKTKKPVSIPAYAKEILLTVI